MEYRVLIVEDDRGIAGAVRDHMAQWGMRAEAVEDFRRVMEDFARVRPHLVLLDVVTGKRTSWLRELTPPGVPGHNR